MKSKVYIFPLLLIVILLFTSCSKNTNSFYETESFNMGTIVTQKVYGSNAKIVSEKVNDIIHSIESKMTANANVGDVYNLNISAGDGNFIPISEETLYILKKSRYFYDLSDGYFDITIGPLVKLWGIGTKDARVPDPNEINEQLMLIGIKNLILDEASKSARLKTVNSQIDLGAIAKGYAADKAIDEYKKNGIKSAYINLGGNVCVLGKKPDGTNWSIGIQNPLVERGKYIGVVKVSDKTIVTSGDYERFYQYNGKRYHHILDPKTGYPANSDLLSVTIVADSSTEADALSTSVYILGLDRGMALINSLSNVDAIFVTTDKKIFVSDNLIDNFEFSDESGEFTYVKKR